MFELVLHLLDLLVPLLDGLAHHGDVLPAGLRVRPAARGHDGSVEPRAELLDLSVLVVTDTSHLIHLAAHLNTTTSSRIKYPDEKIFSLASPPH